MKQIIFLAAAATLTLTSCKKDEVVEYNPNVKAPLTIEFDNVAGSNDLQLNTGSYTNASGEVFNVSKLKYYISNVRLTKTDGTVYTIPQEDSYFLVDESDEATHEAELSVPEGEYKTVEFVLGVDSLRSTMDISQRTGVLDPAGAGADMYWNPNNGYIFFKMEGSSPASTVTANEFKYHIGGFGGYTSPTINNIKAITLNLATNGVPKVKAGKATNIHLMVDVMKMFNGTTHVSIASNATVMFDPFSASIANNYASMFTHAHTEN